MKKRLFAVLMAATMVASLVACGPTETPATTEEAPATEAPATDNTPEPKKPTYADDFMNRAARFFGDDE